MNIGERIRLIRKKENLNQTEFGEKIGIKQGSIAGYETNKRLPLDTVISSICREFNIRDEWLRTGEGNMYNPQDRQTEIAKLTKILLDEEDDSFKNRLISVLANLNEEEWELLANMAERITKKD